MKKLNSIDVVDVKMILSNKKKTPDINIDTGFMVGDRGLEPRTH